MVCNVTADFSHTVLLKSLNCLMHISVTYSEAPNYIYLQIRGTGDALKKKDFQTHLMSLNFPNYPFWEGQKRAI